MKSNFLNFLKRNFIFIILSFVHPLAMLTFKYWGTIVLSNTALGPFRTYDFYVICFLPIFHFIYGCVAYIIIKKIWFPQLILFVSSFVFLIIFNIHMLFNGMALSVISIIFSLIGTIVTSFICWIIREMKENYK